MSYKLRFHELALAEWKKLDGSVREPLKKSSKSGCLTRASPLPHSLAWSIATRSSSGRLVIGWYIVSMTTSCLSPWSASAGETGKKFTRRRNRGCGRCCRRTEHVSPRRAAGAVRKGYRLRLCRRHNFYGRRNVRARLTSFRRGRRLSDPLRSWLAGETAEAVAATKPATVSVLPQLPCGRRQRAAPGAAR